MHFRIFEAAVEVGEASEADGECCEEDEEGDDG